MQANTFLAHPQQYKMFLNFTYALLVNFFQDDIVAANPATACSSYLFFITEAD
jgi:hypothetical protein